MNDYILTPKEMYDIDNYYINNLSIPSGILMENAAHSSANIIKTIVPVGEELWILCGSGNNGGDGFAIARHLSEVYNIKVGWIGDTEKMSSETYFNISLLEQLDISVVHIKDETLIPSIRNKYVIDAIFGIGANEDLKGLVVELLKVVNQIGNKFIAIDSPTGLNSLSGRVNDNTFVCSDTITMFAAKCGMYFNDGPRVCGKIHVASLGVPSKKVINKLSVPKYLCEKKTIANLIKRDENTHKYDLGNVVIIAGSKLYPGAGVLSANACISSGAGIVHLISEDYNSNLLPEIIPYKIECTEGQIKSDNIEHIKLLIDKADTIVFGCGIGDNINFKEIFEYFIDLNNKNIIIDANGLDYIDTEKRYNKNIILTPHLGEYSKLINKSKDIINNDRLASVCESASKLNLNILLKGPCSIITNGEKSIINTSGNNGLSTAGSGDVLAGMLGAVLSKKDNLCENAAIVVHSHGLIAENFAKDNLQSSLTASEIIKNIKKLGSKY